MVAHRFAAALTRSGRLPECIFATHPAVEILGLCSDLVAIESGMIPLIDNITLLLILVGLPATLVVCLLLPRTLLLWLWSILTFLPRISLLNIPAYSSFGTLMLLLRTPIGYLRGQRLPGIIGSATSAGAVAALSALWSPAPTDALISAFAWFGVAAGMFAMTYLVWTEGHRAIGRLLIWSSPLIVTQAFTTIYFRFQQPAELAYYGSGVAKAILGTAATGLTTGDVVNNVLDPNRAAGIFFTSVNRAALAMGVMMVTYLAYAFMARRRWPWIIAALLGAAIILGGSKTGLALSIVLPVFSFVLASVANSANAAGKISIVFAALVGSAIAIQIFLATADDYISASEQTLLPRLVLWSESSRAIAEDPLLGLGFGGWFQRWESGRVDANFTMRPAHNWALQAWMDGGILYLTLLVLFVLSAAILLVRSVSRIGSYRDRVARALSGSAFIWCFIHGMGDNTPLFADPPATLFLSICAAIMITTTFDEPAPGTNLNGGDRNRGKAAIPRVTSVSPYAVARQAER